ncbi:MAG: hypothetical protein QNJ72_13380 [Pleurocapsa sp. MO_226.B13]|nr:hypothetical protein [Pleurocapsa sp. MO_226.B13]
MSLPLRETNLMPQIKLATPVGWVKQARATQQKLMDVGFRTSNATCYKVGNLTGLMKGGRRFRPQPLRNAVAPQPTFFQDDLSSY